MPKTQTWMVLLLAPVAVSLSVGTARGQGCIVARSSSQLMGPESQAGYLEDGEFESSIGYRHQFSYKHFVGPTEQTYRVQQGTEVMNKINLEDVDLTYQITPRCSVFGDVPLLLASRRSNNSPVTFTAQGIGDAIAGTQAWLFSPKKKTHGNLMVGLGVLMPTGKSGVANTVDKFDGKGPQTQIVDYSIQPGGGGWGMVFRWQAFRSFGQSVAYVSGNYIATQGGHNSVLRTGQDPASLNAYNAISDQYLVEAGIARPVRRVSGLSWTIGPRWEGVPAYNLIGEDLGFRRPGFAISIQPGFQYARSGNMFGFSVGKAIYRDRTRSVPDILSGTHGDAAFADYVWLASYSYRFHKPNVEH
jgi:hypothetical protein